MLLHRCAAAAAFQCTSELESGGLQVGKGCNIHCGGLQVGTRDAIFILISDLNEEKLEPDLPTRKAQSLIRQRAKER